MRLFFIFIGVQGSIGPGLFRFIFLSMKYPISYIVGHAGEKGQKGQQGNQGSKGFKGKQGPIVSRNIFS